jgi:hypothetical protein
MEIAILEACEKSHAELVSASAFSKTDPETSSG